jgi:ribosomal protein L37AE/L43A
MAPPCKYNTEEERITAYKAQQNQYTMKKWECETCNCTIRLGNKTNHLNSVKHSNNANGIDAKPNLRNSDIWICDACDVEMQLESKRNHLKSVRHIRNAMKDEL